jgi:hypothetical protein
MNETPELTDDVRGYLGAMGQRGQRIRWAGKTEEQRQQATAAARAARSARPTTSERLKAAEERIETLMAAIDELRSERTTVAA